MTVAFLLRAGTYILIMIRDRAPHLRSLSLSIFPLFEDFTYPLFFSLLLKLHLELRPAILLRSEQDSGVVGPAHSLALDPVLLHQPLGHIPGQVLAVFLEIGVVLPEAKAAFPAGAEPALVTLHHIRSAVEAAPNRLFENSSFSSYYGNQKVNNNYTFLFAL